MNNEQILVLMCVLTIFLPPTLMVVIGIINNLKDKYKDGYK